MDPNRLLPLLPNLEIVAVSTDTLAVAQSKVMGCEACDPAAQRPFSCLLDEITDHKDFVTDYVLVETAACRNCGAEISERTLVAFESASNSDASALAFLDLSIEEADIVLVDSALLAEAEEWIAGCEHCSDQTEYSFDQILDSLTGNDPTKTEYLLEREAKCPRCRSAVNEKSLVCPA
jgi:predicted Zn-ribbon and HTH transcriptional regulator